MESKIASANILQAVEARSEEVVGGWMGERFSELCSTVNKNNELSFLKKMVKHYNCSSISISFGFGNLVTNLSLICLPNFFITFSPILNH